MKISELFAVLKIKPDQASISKTNQVMGKIHSGLRGLVAYASFRVGKKLLIDYNSEMDDARIKMQTLIALGTKTPFAENAEKAAAAVRQMTADAAVGVGTTKDYVSFAGEITKPLLDAGASMEQLTDLTRAGVTAAKTLKIANDVAGRDIQQMMLGQVRQVDRLPKLLGVNAEAWNEMFRSKGPQHALEELTKVLDTPQMKDAAKKYGESWSGVTSTLEDNFARLFGRIGLPLMNQLAKAAKTIRKYFEKNPKKIEAFVEVVGGFFEIIGKVLYFLLRHADKVLFALGSLKLAMIALSIQSKIAAAGSAAAWAATLIPLLAVAAIIALVIVVFNDLIAAFQGKNSVLKEMWEIITGFWRESLDAFIKYFEDKLEQVKQMARDVKSYFTGEETSSEQSAANTAAAEKDFRQRNALRAKQLRATIRDEDALFEAAKAAANANAIRNIGPAPANNTNSQSITNTINVTGTADPAETARRTVDAIAETFKIVVPQ